MHFARLVSSLHANALVCVAGIALAVAVRAQPQRASSTVEPAELVLHAGAVYTADARLPAASAVAVRGGRIVYVGDDDGVRPFMGADTRTIEIRDGMVLPGFHDSHVHIAAGSLGLATCDLSGDETAEAVAARWVSDHRGVRVISSVFTYLTGLPPCVAGVYRQLRAAASSWAS